MKYSIIIFIVTVTLLTKTTFAQKALGEAVDNFELNMIFSRIPSDFETPSYNIEYTDSLKMLKELSQTITQIQSRGYAETSLDSNINSNNKYTYYVSIGNKYLWHELRFNSSEWKMLQNLKQESLDFNNKSFDYEKLIALQNDIITQFENSGYPFASTYLNEIQIDNNKVSAKLIIDKGALIKIDTIELTNFKGISNGYIQQYLKIANGSEYNESRISEIYKLINRLDFIQIDKPLRIDFSDQTAEIFLSLKPKKTNQFNGIMGMASDPKTKKLVFTGNLHLKLVNSFGRGERVSLLWESPGNSSQLLNINLQYPYLFNSPFGIALDFRIDKKDTTYVNMEYKPAIQFAMSGQDHISTYIHVFQSNYLLNNDGRNPNSKYNDVNSQTGGLGLYINRLDNIFNPQRGFKININIDGGYKQFTKYSNNTEEHINELLLRGSSNLEYFLPIFKRQTLRLSNTMALIEGEHIMLNELYRIGGFKTFRGFDEQSLLASFYNIYSLEYRLLLDQYSYLGVFYNIGHIVNPYAAITANTHQSFGLSFNFATKAGVFGLSYAIGKTEASDFEFGRAKIHFGYMAVF